MKPIQFGLGVLAMAAVLFILAIGGMGVRYLVSDIQDIEIDKLNPKE